MDRHETSNRRAYLGIFLIAVGGIWILERMGWLPSFWGDILISWQMLLIGIGVFSLISGNKTAGTILVVIGGFFLLPDIVHIPFEIRRVVGWPIFVILIGLALLYTSSSKHRRGAPSFDTGQHAGARPGMDYFDDFVVFGGREVYINSQNFVGGKTSSVFGGAEYDLRQARLSPNGAVVDCLAVFGGCGFKVPPDWTVKNEVTAIFGAFTDKRGSTINHVASDPSKTLIIKGFAAFGGVEIKYI